MEPNLLFIAAYMCSVYTVYSVYTVFTYYINKLIDFQFVDPPSITNISGNQTVTVGDIVTLICTADGRPTPNITWTRLSDNSVVTFPLTITGIQDEGAYRCTADNGIGNPAGRDVFITVQSKFSSWST